MSKFCVNCGTQLPEEANACPSCNTAVEPSKVEKAKKADNALIAKVKAAFKKGHDAVAAKMKSFGIPMKAVYVALAALLVLIVVVSLFANAYKAPIKRLIDIEYYGKVQKIEKMIPNEYLEYLEEERERDIDDIIDDAKEEWESTQESLEDQYGDNYKVSYKILYKGKLSKDELEDVRDSLKDRYDISKSSVKQAYEMYVKITIKGSEDEQTTKGIFYSVNIDGSWYLVSQYGSFPFN